MTVRCWAGLRLWRWAESEPEGGVGVESCVYRVCVYVCVCVERGYAMLESSLIYAKEGGYAEGPVNLGRV